MTMKSLPDYIGWWHPVPEDERGLICIRVFENGDHGLCCETIDGKPQRVTELAADFCAHGKWIGPFNSREEAIESYIKSRPVSEAMRSWRELRDKLTSLEATAAHYHALLTRCIAVMEAFRGEDGNMPEGTAAFRGMKELLGELYYATAPYEVPEPVIHPTP